jgi:hypothetical protein
MALQRPYVNRANKLKLFDAAVGDRLDFDWLDNLPTTIAGYGIVLTAADVNGALGYTAADNAALGGYQPLDGDLSAIAALGTTGVVKRTGTNTWSAGPLVAADIPNLDTAKVTTGTFADARIAQSNVTQHQAALAIGWGQLTGSPPALLVTEVYTVGSQAAQLALVAEEGDIAIRTDLNKSYAHNGGTAGTMADWSELLTPTDAVLSFNTRTGAITLTSGDVTGALTFTPPPNTRTLTAGNGLTGGGTLAADRTFTLGTPSTVNNAATNSVSSTTHTHAVSLTHNVSLAADLPSSYPVNTVTMGQINSGTGWPSTNGTILSVVTDVSGNRVFQLHSQPKGGSSVPSVTVRSHHSTDGGGGWTAFYDLYHSGNQLNIGTTAATARTALEATTVGSSLFRLTNPSAITFLRVNADNSVTALSDSAFRTAIGLGTSATVNTGTSGATIPLLNGNNTFSGTATFSNVAGLTASAGPVSDSIGNLRDIPPELRNATQAFGAADRGKIIYKNNTTAYTWTINSGASAGWAIMVKNFGSAGNVTIARNVGAGVALFDDTGTNADFTLLPGQSRLLVCFSSTIWGVF